MIHPLRVAILLLFSAGFMDAFTYLAYGHVFANAMSGNVVQIAVALPQGNWPEIYRHLPPLAAFFPGILAARWLMARAAATPYAQVARRVLTAQVLLLLLTALGIHQLPAFAVTACIAFMSSMQNTTFRTIGPLSYTSVVTTGNLRSLGESIFGWITGDRSKYRGEIQALSSICLAFAAGATTGAVMTHLLHRQAIWVPLAILVIVLGIGRADRPTPPAELQHPA
ncbi:YoaK family protein [Frateuria aurantia]